jgi:hypothetical protein
MTVMATQAAVDETLDKALSFDERRRDSPSQSTTHMNYSRGSGPVRPRRNPCLRVQFVGYEAALKHGVANRGLSEHAIATLA